LAKPAERRYQRGAVRSQHRHFGEPPHGIEAIACDPLGDAPT
jgi:hypothetical protein